MSDKALLAKRITLTALCAMVVVLSINILGITQLAPLSRAVFWVICIVPLLLFLPGLLRGAWKSYAWMCFALMIYFQAFVTEAFRKPRDPLTLGQIACLLIAFVGAMIYVRLRRKELAGAGA
jgi:uncharacterized membrane protein